ncbi:fatty acid desaturase [Pseudoroseicyclus sp. CXY001]|uniref:fatty acid desaturase n=1 Tax=Pseudoroseicyclus sp. CXY001 TaxID=3242492 RepID=UPI003570EB50
MSEAARAREIIAALPPEERARLTARADAAGLRHLALYLGAIALCSCWIALRLPLWPVVLLPQGLLLTFLFTLEHECTHETPFASGRLALWVGRASGLVILLPFTWFRAFHMAHHRWTNLPGKDPELAVPKPEGARAMLLHYTGLPYWAGQIALLARLSAGRADDSFLPPRLAAKAIREARVMVAVYAVALASLALIPALFWLWILPLILTQPALRAYLLAEHGDCPEVAEMLENTRTTFTTKAVRFLAWNMPYHTEHHAWPQVPFHRLPEVHAAFREHLKVTAPGYAAFTRGYLARHR